MDLSTTFLGLKLRTPLVPSASPLSEEIHNIKKMEDEGASAVVLYSLFEEQLRRDRLELAQTMEAGTFSFPEALTYFPEVEDFHLGPEEYLKHISRAKEAVKMPVIASLNGSSRGGWTDYAKQIQQAGADALGGTKSTRSLLPSNLTPFCRSSVTSCAIASCNIRHS